MIEILVAVAIDSVASAADLALLERAEADLKVDVKAIRGWLHDLQRLPPMPNMADRLDFNERIVTLDSFMMIARGGALPEDAGFLTKLAFKGIDWEPALRLTNQLCDRMAAAMRLKDRAERQKKLSQIQKDLDEKIKKSRQPGAMGNFLGALTTTPRKIGEQSGQILLGLLMPAVYKVIQASDRSEQIQRNLHVAFALACYHREHGRYPDKLDALAPAFLERVPQDLFSGTALIYRPSDKGYLLYSVGVNGRDDEGRGFGDDEDADDLSVRMPLPELRRK